MVSKIQRRRNNNIFEAIAVARKRKGKKNPQGFKAQRGKTKQR